MTDSTGSVFLADAVFVRAVGVAVVVVVDAVVANGLGAAAGCRPGTVVVVAVLRAVVLAAEQHDWEVWGIERGYSGVLGEINVRRLDRKAVRGIHHLGGTILGTTNRGNPFAMPTNDSSGDPVEAGDPETVDRSAEVLANLKQLEIDALIAVGGDGSMEIAHRFSKLGLPVIGVPKTIDNDLNGTVVTFGFQTAVTVATEAVDSLHSTAEAHDRVFVIEVMGRYAGWIALHAGLAGGADVILIPEIPYELDSVKRAILAREARGRTFSLVVVAEGARPRGGDHVTRPPQHPGGALRLGGIGERLTAELAIRIPDPGSRTRPGASARCSW